MQCQQPARSAPQVHDTRRRCLILAAMLLVSCASLVAPHTAVAAIGTVLYTPNLAQYPNADASYPRVIRLAANGSANGTDRQWKLRRADWVRSEWNAGATLGQDQLRWTALSLRTLTHGPAIGAFAMLPSKRRVGSTGHAERGRDRACRPLPGSAERDRCRAPPRADRRDLD
jgi:hypothetical protein